MRCWPDAAFATPVKAMEVVGDHGGLLHFEAAGQGKSMISNDSPSLYGSRPHSERMYGAPKPPVNEDTLKSEKIQIERKTFVFALKENPRGRFLRITEDVGGRRDTIIIPAPGLDDFKKLLDEMVKAATEMPPNAA